MCACVGGVLGVTDWVCGVKRDLKLAGKPSRPTVLKVPCLSHRSARSSMDVVAIREEVVTLKDNRKKDNILVSK